MRVRHRLTTPRRFLLAVAAVYMVAAVDRVAKQHPIDR